MNIGAIGLGNPFSNFPNRPKVTGQMYHFADDRECASTVWTQSGTGTEVTFTVATDEVGGAVQATTATSGYAQGDSVFAQASSEQFKFSLGAEVLFLARFQIDSETAGSATIATDSQFFVGLAITTANGVAGGTSGTGNVGTDLIGFWTDDGDLNIDFVYGKNVATSNANYTHASNAIGTYAAGTYKDYAFRVKMDPDTAQLGTVTAWLDGVKVYEATLSDLPEDEELALTMGVATGATTGSKYRLYKTDLIGAIQRAA